MPVSGADHHQADKICLDSLGTPAEIDPRHSSNAAWGNLLKAVNEQPGPKTGVRQMFGYTTEPKVMGDANSKKLGHLRSIVDYHAPSKGVTIAKEQTSYSLEALTHGDNGALTIPTEAQTSTKVSIKGPHQPEEICPKCAHALKNFTDLREKAEDARLNISDWTKVKKEDPEWGTTIDARETRASLPEQLSTQFPAVVKSFASGVNNLAAGINKVREMASQ